MELTHSIGGTTSYDPGVGQVSLACPGAPAIAQSATHSASLVPLRSVSRHAGTAPGRRFLLSITPDERAPAAMPMQCAQALGLEVTLGENNPAEHADCVQSDIVGVIANADYAKTLEMVRALVQRSPGIKLIVFGLDHHASASSAALAAGATGYIPLCYGSDSMAAAMSLILAGERFQPCPPGPFNPGSDTHAKTAIVVTTPAPNSNTGIQEYGLTKVEREVLSLAARGLTNHEIALRRGGREGTIKVHMNHIFGKLSVRSRCEAIAVYLHSNNVDPDELHRAQSGNMDLKWLVSTMTHMRQKAGSVLFRKGEHGDKIYYLQNGTVLLQEINVEMRPQDLFGEIGVFSKDHKRTCTAVCKTDVDLFTLSFDEVYRCYFLNPQFAFYVMYLVTQRLMADRDRVHSLQR